MKGADIEQESARRQQVPDCFTTLEAPIFLSWVVLHPVGHRWRPVRRPITTLASCH